MSTFFQFLSNNFTILSIEFFYKVITYCYITTKIYFTIKNYKEYHKLLFPVLIQLSLLKLNEVWFRRFIKEKQENNIYSSLVACADDGIFKKDYISNKRLFLFEMNDNFKILDKYTFYKKDRSLRFVEDSLFYYLLSFDGKSAIYLTTYKELKNIGKRIYLINYQSKFLHPILHEIPDYFEYYLTEINDLDVEYNGGFITSIYVVLNFILNIPYDFFKIIIFSLIIIYNSITIPSFLIFFFWIDLIGLNSMLYVFIQFEKSIDIMNIIINSLSFIPKSIRNRECIIGYYELNLVKLAIKTNYHA